MEVAKTHDSNGALRKLHGKILGTFPTHSLPSEDETLCDMTSLASLSDSGEIL